MTVESRSILQQTATKASGYTNERSLLFLCPSILVPENIDSLVDAVNARKRGIIGRAKPSDIWSPIREASIELAPANELNAILQIDASFTQALLKERKQRKRNGQICDRDIIGVDVLAYTVSQQFPRRQEKEDIFFVIGPQDTPIEIWGRTGFYTTQDFPMDELVITARLLTNYSQWPRGFNTSHSHTTVESLQTIIEDVGYVLSTAYRMVDRLDGVKQKRQMPPIRLGIPTE